MSNNSGADNGSGRRGHGKVLLKVRHNFETAHRLPFLGGKCMNLHGHSWDVEVTFYAHAFKSGMNSNGISLEYGLLKKVVRSWIDDKLDHGCMLGVKDPLLPFLLEEDSKVFVFGDVNFLHNMTEQESRSSYNVPAPDRNYPHLPWPTVEATARMISETIQELVNGVFNPILSITSVLVTETSTNAALWTAEGQGEDPADRMSLHEAVTLSREEISATSAALRGEDIHP